MFTPSVVAGAPRPVVAVGRLLVWHGASVWIGRDTGRVQAHRHHAIQITLAPMGPVRMSAAGESWRELTAAIVMPDRPHVLDGGEQPVAMVFVEPETATGRALVSRYGEQDVWDVSDDRLSALAGELHGQFQLRAPDHALIATARRVIDCLAPAHARTTVLDPRVAAVVGRIRDDPGRAVTLAHAAAWAHLSPGRFRHLFVAQTGITFRAYLLWARVVHAVARGMAGSSWTDAAQQAGFSDSAHLSRTCRRMFGVAPTMLVAEERDRSSSRRGGSLRRSSTAA